MIIPQFATDAPVALRRDGSGNFSIRTFVADHFDRLGMPVCWSWVTCKGQWGRIEPFVQWGKGLTRRAARADAEANAVMKLSAHVFADTPLVRARYTEVADHAVHPRIIENETEEVKAGRDAYTDDLPIDWRWAYDLVARVALLVPAVFVQYGYKAPKGAAFGRQTTDGLGTGRTREEAALEAVLSLACTDSAYIVLRNRLAMPDVRLDALRHPRLRRLIGSLGRQGIDLHIKDFTTDVGIPTFGVLLEEESHPKGPFITHGFAAHLDTNCALLRAVTEAIQWRSFYLKTLAELSPRMHRSYCASRYLFDPRMKDAYACMLARGRVERAFSSIGTTSIGRTDGALSRCLEKVKNVMARPMVLIVDLTRPELGLCTMRVIIPELQAMDEVHQVTSRRLHAVPRILGYAEDDTGVDSLYAGRLP